MLISFQRLLNTPIVSLQTGAPLGQASEPIIDPRQLFIVAFYCNGPRIHGRAVLHTEDIREISNVGLIVDNADRLMAQDDLVRLKEVTRMRFTVIGKVVVDEQGRKLGKVEDYSIDIESFYIMKLTVRRSIMRSFMGSTLLIDRTQIVEVTDHQIVVQGAEVKEPKVVRKSAPLIDNPFRNHETPQGTAIRTEEPRA